MISCQCQGNQSRNWVKINSIALIWDLSGGGGDIPFMYTRSQGVGATTTAGIFTAEIIDTSDGGIV